LAANACAIPLKNAAILSAHVAHVHLVEDELNEELQGEKGEK
jgi:hypothetical protein